MATGRSAYIGIWVRAPSELIPLLCGSSWGREMPDGLSYAARPGGYRRHPSGHSCRRGRDPRFGQGFQPRAGGHGRTEGPAARIQRLRHRSPRSAGCRCRVPGDLPGGRLRPQRPRTYCCRISTSSATALRALSAQLPSKARRRSRTAQSTQPIPSSSWLADLVQWLASITGGEDRETLVRSQLPYARDDERIVGEDVDRYTAACREVLHPVESRRPKRRRRLARR